MPARTEVFTKLVRDYMGAAPVIVTVVDRCDHMLGEMRRRDSSSAIAVDADGSPAGIVTEQDIAL